MATDLKAAPKHEQFVEQQLDRVSKRLHALDLGRLGLLLAALILGQALVMAALDLAAGPRAGGFVTALRLTVWGISLSATLLVGGWLVYRLFSSINPYYAAQQIEQTIPDAKNSVVNWLDLREEPLAPVVKTTLGLRAARDLKTTDPDQSIHARKNTWRLAVVIGVLVMGLVGLLIREPGRFGSLMRRAFLPIGEFTLGTRTRITLVQPDPARGDMIVKPQQSVSFEVRLAGAVPRTNTPQEARVLFRYEADQSWVSLPLEEREGAWTAVMESDRVQNGFTYKIAAGDAETSENRVIVQSLPGYAALPARWFEIDYHYPAYTHIPNRKVTSENEVYPRISGPAGTQVTLLIRANRDLHSGKIELNLPNSTREIPGTLLEEDARAFRCKFTLEQSGQFNIRFTTRAGDLSSDNIAYQLIAIADSAPVVELKKPGKDIELPANGTLQLEGLVSDDFGIKSVVLHFEVKRRSIKTALASKTYRPEKSFQFEDGSYADRIDYRDFVALPQLKDNNNQDAGLGKGDVLYYWLEATDNCDYPEGRANTGHSKTYMVTLGDTHNQEKQKQDEQKAQNEQRKHEDRQDQDLKKQEADRKEKQRQEQNRAAGKEGAQGNEGAAGNEGAQGAEKQQQDDFLNQAKQALEKDKQGQPGNKPGNGGEQGQKKDWTEKDVDNLKKMLEDKGPLGDWARDQMKQARENARDAGVRDAAQNAMKNQDGTDKATQDKLKELAKNKDAVGEAAANELAQQAQQARDESARKAAEKALKEAGRENQKPASGTQGGASASESQKKEWTEKDLEEINKMLKDKGPLGDWARQQLKDASEKAKNSQVRDAAQQAMKDQQPTDKASQDKLKELAKQKGAAGDAAAEELARQAQQANDEAARKAAEKALKEAGRENQKPASGTQGGASASENQKKEWTEKDLEKMNKILEDKGPLGDWARQQLKDAGQNAKDSQVRGAAQQAMKDQQPTDKASQDKLKELAKQKGEAGDAAAQELARQAQQAGNEAARKEAEKALKEAGREDILKNTGKPDTGKPQQWTEKDVEKLTKLSQEKGPVGDFARQQLKEAAKASDPAVRDAAQKALSEQQATDKESQARLKELAKQPGAAGDAAAEELARQAQQAKDETARKEAEKALKEAGRDGALKPAAGGNSADSTKTADPHKHVTMKEIEQLKEVQKKKGFLGDLAKGDLAEAARLAQDPKVRAEAQKALNDPARHTEEPNAHDVPLIKEMAKEKSQVGAAARRELDRLATEGKGDEVRDAARTALKELGPQNNARHDPIRDANAEDVNKLKKTVNKEGLLGDATAQTLNEIARNAKDAEVRKKALEALKQRDPAKTEEVTSEEVEQMSKLLPDRGPGGEAMAREMARLIHDSKKPAVREAAMNALDRNNIDRQTLERKENVPPSPVDSEAGRRGGSLSIAELKELKKSMTPEKLKQLGKTQAEFDRIIDDAMKRARDEANLLGNQGQLPSTAPRLVDPNNPTSSSLQGNRGQPPPGWGGVYDRWTTQPPGSDKK